MKLVICSRQEVIYARPTEKTDDLINFATVSLSLSKKRCTFHLQDLFKPVLSGTGTLKAKHSNQRFKNTIYAYLIASAILVLSLFLSSVKRRIK